MFLFLGSKIFLTNMFHLNCSSPAIRLTAVCLVTVKKISSTGFKNILLIWLKSAGFRTELRSWSADFSYLENARNKKNLKKINEPTTIVEHIGYNWYYPSLTKQFDLHRGSWFRVWLGCFFQIKEVESLKLSNIFPLPQMRSRFYLLFWAVAYLKFLC